jgi:DNA helicase-2/ATP-dependent DNA helicase PcrA
MNVRAVLFDLDGTLIDTEKYYMEVWPKAAEHFGLTLTREMALELRSLGRPYAPEQFKRWFGDVDYYEIREYRRGLFKEVLEKGGLHLKPGAKELLQYLRDRKILCAVATATAVDRATSYLDQAGVLPYFDRICSAADAPLGKPAPDVYLHACNELRLRPEMCLAVEDAPNGIRSAYDAGCKVVFVPDQTSEEPEAEALCIATCRDLHAMIKLLEGEPDFTGGIRYHNS